MWQRQYGSDPSILGSALSINGKPFTVVGITPPGFFGDTLRSRSPDFFFPLNTEPVVMPDADLNKADTHWLNVMGRVAQGAAPASIETEMRVELQQWLRAHWEEMSENDRAVLDRQTLYLSPGGAGIPSLRVQYEQWLKILMTVSGFVLLIVCANIANLMLLRGIRRRRQTALRVALGAQPRTLVRQALTESLVLSLLGGAAGAGLALAGTRLILYFAFPSTDGSPDASLGAWPSVPLLLFAVSVSLLTGVVFGIAPALLAARAEPIEALREGQRTTARAGTLPRKALVVFQAALSLALLSATGLLSGALCKLEHQDFGFEQNGRIVVNMQPRLAGYRAEQLHALYGRIRDAIASIPGVASVALALYSPESGDRWGAGVWVDGAPPPAPGAVQLASWDRVTSGYFDVIGHPIVKGRGVTEEDTPVSRRVAVVNQAFARAYFQNRDPLGKHFGVQPGASRQFEIVGVAKDARYDTIDDPVGPVPPFFFLPEAQADYTQSNLGSLFLHDIVILTTPGASLSLAQVSNTMASADPDLPIIAMRMALGADRGRVLTLVLRGALGLVACGLLAGLPLAFGAGRFLGSLLYGLNPYDPVAVLLAAATLGLSGLAAALVPAFRATHVSAVEALREPG